MYFKWYPKIIAELSVKGNGCYHLCFKKTNGEIEIYHCLYVYKTSRRINKELVALLAPDE